MAENCMLILPEIVVPQYVEEAARAGVLVIDMDCDAIAAPGDLVRLDDSVSNKVVVAIDNLIGRPIIGRIRAKLTTITCEVVLKGVVDVTGVPVGRVWLSDTGDFTTVKPNTGYLQDLGYSFGNDKLNLDPTNVLTLQS
jgi:hypothetical protein